MVLYVFVAYHTITIATKATVHIILFDILIINLLFLLYYYYYFAANDALTSHLIFRLLSVKNTLTFITNSSDTQTKYEK